MNNGATDGQQRPESGADYTPGLLGWIFESGPPDPDLNWPAVLHAARQHQVWPFLFYRLQPYQDSVPSDVWQAIQSDFLLAVGPSVTREQELKRVLMALEEVAVPVTLLKGAALAHTAYPYPVLRMMTDTDLWIARECVEDAKAALAPYGYVPGAGAVRPQPLQDALDGETRMYSQRPQSRLVELHWRIFAGEWVRYAARIDEAAIWERKVRLEALPAYRLSVEDALLHTCVHCAIHHQFGGLGLRPFLDLAMMAQHWTVRWDVVIARAREWQVCTATWLVLDTLGQLSAEMQDQIPTLALRPSRLRRWLLGRFVSPQSLLAGRDIRSSPLRFVFLLLLVDRPADAARLVLRAVFPERQWFILRYQLEDASNLRIWLQRLWHPIRALLRAST